MARRIAGPWRSIVIGMTISAGLAAIAVAVSVGAFIYRHHDSKYVPQAAAEAEFERARRPFARQRPTVEVRDGADPVVSPRSASAMREHGAAAHTLHTLVFESRTGKLVRISLPFRVVRLMHPNGFTYLGGLTFLEDTEFDSDRVLLTLDDIERDEPTLVVDHRHPGGGRFLVWVD